MEMGLRYILTLILLASITTTKSFPTIIPGETKSANIIEDTSNKTQKLTINNITADETAQKQITDSIKKIVTDQQNEQANKNYKSATIQVQAQEVPHDTQSEVKYYSNQQKPEDIQTPEINLYSAAQTKTFQQELPHVTNTKSVGDVEISESKYYPVVQSKTQNYQSVLSAQQALPHLISNFRTSSEYPLLSTKYDIQNIEKMSREELKIKCQHLSKILGALNNTEYSSSTTTIPTPVRNSLRPLDFQRPTYIHNRPVFASRYDNSKLGAFYVTSQSNGQFITTPRPRVSSTTFATTTPVPTYTSQSPSLSHQIKYIRLEPVILQKTILNDGRVLYYWHRSLPTTVEQPAFRYLTTQVPPRLHEVHEVATTEPPTTSSSTTEYSSYIGFMNFLPFYGGQQSSVETTLPPTTTSTTTSTTPKPTTKSSTEQTQYNPDPLFSPQLKFVVPLPYNNDGNIGGVKSPWDFDPYAYYPKALQPARVKVEVPYSPNFHVIKSLTLPNTPVGKQREKLDDVSLT